MSGAWSYILTPPARREMDRLPLDARRRAFAALDHLAESGAGDLRKLAGHEGEWRLRVGDYRVLFYRDRAARRLVVLHVLQRGRAYRS